MKRSVISTTKPGRSPRLAKPSLILFLTICCYFLLVMLWGLSRHYGNLNALADIGVFDQAIWGALNLGRLHNTINFSAPINLLGFHFMPVLYGFVPLYFFKPTVHWLTFAQSAATALAAVPIYLVSKKATGSAKAGFFWALAYLFNPFVLAAVAWDFHPITLTLPFIATGLLAVVRNKFRWLLFCCLFILLCKEHLGGMVAGFGLLWWFRHRQLAPAICLILLGTCHAVIVFAFIMPHFSPTGAHVMFGADMGGLSRYAWLGETPQEILWTLLTRPVSTAANVILEKSGWLYLANLVLPFLCFPVLALTFMLPAMADLAANMLSANQMPRSPMAYHTTAIIPFLTAAAMYGSRHVNRFRKQYSLPTLAGFCLFANLFFGCFFFFVLPLSGPGKSWAPQKWINLNDPAVREIAVQLMEDTTVSAQSNIGAHFSQREEIFIYPNNIEKSQAIILNLQSPTKLVEERDPRYVGTLAHHLQMPPGKYLASIDALLSDEKWAINYWNDPWLLLTRGSSISVPKTLVKDKIKKLRQDWGITG